MLLLENKSMGSDDLKIDGACGLLREIILRKSYMEKTESEK